MDSRKGATARAKSKKRSDGTDKRSVISEASGEFAFKALLNFITCLSPRAAT
jgi:hypothetical protein